MKILIDAQLAIDALNDHMEMITQRGATDMIEARANRVHYNVQEEAIKRLKRKNAIREVIKEIHEQLNKGTANDIVR